MHEDDQSGYSAGNGDASPRGGRSGAKGGFDKKIDDEIPF
jgi:hypothetical protein